MRKLTTFVLSVLASLALAIPAEAWFGFSRFGFGFGRFGFGGLGFGLPFWGGLGGWPWLGGLGCGFGGCGLGLGCCGGLGWW